MEISWQPHLEGKLIELRPLLASDFEDLYRAAADPLIWEQHPEKGRYKRELFEKYFVSALECKGALLVIDRLTKEVLGCSRFYDQDIEKRSVAIGYTFLTRECWGKPFNKELKKLMIGYAFNYVETVLFFIGINNVRSRKAIERTGAVFVNQDEATAMYRISKYAWRQD